MNMLYLIANYGIYADKQKVTYTIREADIHAERSEGVFAKLPEGWYAYENCYEDSLVKDPDGVIRNLNDLLTSDGTRPVLAWYEAGIYHRMTLEIKSEKTVLAGAEFEKPTDEKRKIIEEGETNE